MVKHAVVLTGEEGMRLDDLAEEASSIDDAIKVLARRRETIAKEIDKLIPAGAAGVKTDNARAIYRESNKLYVDKHGFESVTGPLDDRFYKRFLHITKANLELLPPEVVADLVAKGLVRNVTERTGLSITIRKKAKK